MLYSSMKLSRPNLNEWQSSLYWSKFTMDNWSKGPSTREDSYIAIKYFESYINIEIYFFHHVPKVLKIDHSVLKIDQLNTRDVSLSDSGTPDRCRFSGLV